jgi:hypothetical protein
MSSRPSEGSKSSDAFRRPPVSVRSPHDLAPFVKIGLARSPVDRRKSAAGTGWFAHFSRRGLAEPVNPRLAPTRRGIRSRASPCWRLLPCTSWFNEIVTPPRELSKIAPVIRQIASAIFDQAHAQIADGEGAPGGLSCLAEMDGWGNFGPVCHREWQRRDFFCGLLRIFPYARTVESLVT